MYIYIYICIYIFLLLCSSICIYIIYNQENACYVVISITYDFYTLGTLIEG